MGASVGLAAHCRYHTRRVTIDGLPLMANSTGKTLAA
jgi:hypothetical protein